MQLAHLDTCFRHWSRCRRYALFRGSVSFPFSGIWGLFHIFNNWILHQSYFNSCGHSLDKTHRFSFTFPISGGPDIVNSFGFCAISWLVCIHTFLAVVSSVSFFYISVRTCHTPGCEYCKDSSLSLIYCTNSFQTPYDVLQRAVTGSGSQTVGRPPSLVLFHF